ncbi:hypothetical protein P3W70_06920 [Achromobacter denitrificans]|uniref:hypothetical protein n=1 Tax=Achromobacter denitrificans TaxID=32002 RepID=UPI0023E7935F|nr:hypothetical protein [Achromobacter denitrificans]MDF3858070.1 hypothetical protein [Achromobacter denitrificans]
MTDYINTPPVRELWTRALRALGDVKNGDYLPLGRLQAAFGLELGRKLQDVLAAGERDGLLIIDRGAVPTTYRATFILERSARALSEGWAD